uniref:Uncharacterized protein n=1 Tax=Leptocylindrus danicus TaxID=163516 RepID=A0A7S2PJ93_9STRA|mmetsp:Transcript_4099/g.5946  ORF Transcript_4099/g.5946 Transcript_4099/m.5946 type:complete len:535 (+) Transcript_4099:327-1931(+)|eukprot:CAMPEP_0116044360 /NCGR_PEP_ID=MMETSP0321-20121206/26952_1 /TAXON_ID=163516 /ORGANISM="Leptocylindrus danicus var. danicus, Strain B650" /LENGTH=534 /DNA_ID=CAMNT_0003525439 /DNA_START=117 /DNA_END=1721 /DNA_ORIENTATION=+
MMIRSNQCTRKRKNSTPSNGVIHDYHATSTMLSPGVTHFQNYRHGDTVVDHEGCHNAIFGMTSLDGISPFGANNSANGCGVETREVTPLSSGNQNDDSSFVNVFALSPDDIDPVHCSKNNENINGDTSEDFDEKKSKSNVSGMPNWDERMKKSLKPRRSRRPPVGGKWSTSEDEKLISLVDTYGPKNWKKISRLLGDVRNDVQCLHRYNKVLKPGIQKGPWTEEEDMVVKNIVLKYGVDNVKWSKIAKHLQGRIGKQCRERWYNHLNPSIKKGNWTVQEDEVLFRSQFVFGNRWSEISKLLPGRTENSVKNRFNSMAKKRWLSMADPIFRGMETVGIVRNPNPKSISELHQLAECLFEEVAPSAEHCPNLKRENENGDQFRKRKSAITSCDQDVAKRSKVETPRQSQMAVTVPVSEQPAKLKSEDPSSLSFTGLIPAALKPPSINVTTRDRRRSSAFTTDSFDLGYLDFCASPLQSLSTPTGILDWIGSGGSSRGTPFECSDRANGPLLITPKESTSHSRSSGPASDIESTSYV